MEHNVVLYHRNCNDGFGAAWAAWKKLGYENTDYIPMQYGEDFVFPVCNSDCLIKIYILDFSFSREKMLELHKTYGANNVILLDHHKTALEELKGVNNCFIDMEESGATLAWDFFHSDEKRPGIIDFVKDRDLWEWHMYKSREISALISSYDYDFESWNILREHIAYGFSSAYAEGAAILKTQTKIVNQLVANNSYQYKIDGYSVMGVNSPVFQSEIGEKILEVYSDTPFAVIGYSIEGKDIFSLRSRSDFDVSEVAKKYGGGGHKQAAGFTMPALEKSFYDE